MSRGAQSSLREFASANERHPEHWRVRSRVQTGGHGYGEPGRAGQNRAEPGRAGQSRARRRIDSYQMKIGV